MAALILLPGIALFVAGILFSPAQNGSNQQGQITHLQHEQSRLKDAIAEKEALLALRDQQIESLQAEISAERQQQTAMQEKLDMFNSILDARKGQGVKLLQVTARRLSDQSIAYSFVLAKGGNYPRTASGKIRFSTLNPTNDVVEIPISEDADALPYSTQSHTFVQGTLPWTESWQAKKLRITLLDRRGREIGQYETNINQ